MKSLAGLNSWSVKILKLKYSPQVDANRHCFLLMEKISLRKGLGYDMKNDCIHGVADDGHTRTSDLALSAMCIMAVGIIKKWKQPLGFFLHSRPN